MTAEVGGASPWHGRGKPGERTLTLTALAGEELPVEVDPGEHASLRSLENAVSARLPQLGNASTFLADPIQSAISTNQKYYAIAKQCMVEAGHKGQLKGEVKTVRVLCGRNGKIPPQVLLLHRNSPCPSREWCQDCRRGCVAVLSTTANRPPARHGGQAFAWCLQ